MTIDRVEFFEAVAAGRQQEPGRLLHVWDDSTRVTEAVEAASHSVLFGQVSAVQVSAGTQPDPLLCFWRSYGGFTVSG